MYWQPCKNDFPFIVRVLIVYPWTQRHFGTFGEFPNDDTIIGNAKVIAHGKVVLRSLDKAVKNMDNIMGVYTSLSRYHCEVLRVDPENFRLLADCIIVSIGSKNSSDLTPHVQATWHKFLSAVVEAMGSQYSNRA
ncbi:hemoglobin cathodic subunit beta-like [Myripristis murdjan]|uniref:hemoglobin cathodic subunit beta-like n=1 Tax=Myripristis murdjan TaxID=586833 RepID=UPI0011762A89|nr:hemoglobin cathodic subunit beta-like [Myripristis murdjan]